MKILLVGEYSRLHNSLKEGLLTLGHKVYLNGLNDGFKNYPIDFEIKRKWNSGLLRKLKILINKVSGFDISSYLTYLQVKNNLSKFSGFDIVQLINENSFLCQPKHEKKIINLLKNNNKKIFLLSCGDDYSSVKYYFENRNQSSILTPFLEEKVNKKEYSPVLKYLEKDYKNLHDFLFKKIEGVIASDLDYHFPLLNNPKYIGLVPNPINSDKIEFIKNSINNKIIIFLGININTYTKKGIDYFEKALEIIKVKYSQKIEIIITKNIPYADYINHYNNCHILLDQVYAKDQGYNALEAMAKGKVVFTGAGYDFMKHYNLKERVAIHAKDDVEYLVNELSFLIENPNEIIRIQKNARLFIEKEHNYIITASNYLKFWGN
ncbi:glycosyltransferase [Flavobacterium terrae]|uniref:Glycosyl transferases group 1 n=1 Tax=Flavobacterium terrae TaxID=415425 RepID=A0A1M6CN63_9FLAO|nr:glycosyltransferase [Flavobacterium terrae]SHI62446.1 Glycosyl transferases group 1 [Flavobacterium terrae]